MGGHASRRENKAEQIARLAESRSRATAKTNKLKGRPKPKAKKKR